MPSTNNAPLCRWIAAHAGTGVVDVSDAIDPVSDQSSATCGEGDRTIVARRPLRAGDVVVSLRGPSAFLNGREWLQRLATREPPTATAADVERLERRLDQLQPSGTIRTVLALLHERAHQNRSSFAGYLEQLPTEIALPLAWRPSERAMLQSTAAFPIVDHDLVQNVYKRFVAVLVAEFPNVWDAKTTTFEDFVWAYSVVSSRAFSITDAQEPTLLPVIDMANHDPVDPAAHIQYGDNGCYSLIACRAIGADEAVTISYGELSNAQLLCRYGFVLPQLVDADSILISSGQLRVVYAHLQSGGSVDGALRQLATMDGDRGKPAGDDGDDDEQSRAQKRRKLFGGVAGEASADAEDIVFALHGRVDDEFGISDSLLSFVFANNLPAELIYDVLTVLLQHKDKAYSEILSKPVASSTAALMKAVVELERQVCRRILVGIMTLEEGSEDEDDHDGDEEVDGSDSYGSENDEEG